MKLTKEVLKKIINEELEKSINEGFFDSVKRAFGSDEYVPLPCGNRESMTMILSQGHDGNMPSDHPNIKKLRSVIKMFGDTLDTRIGDQVDLISMPQHQFADAQKLSTIDHRTRRPRYDDLKEAYLDLWRKWEQSPQAKNLKQEINNLTNNPGELQAVKVKKLNQQVLDAFKDWGYSYVDQLENDILKDMKFIKSYARDADEKRRRDRDQRLKGSSVGEVDCKEVNKKCREKHYNKDYYDGSPSYQRRIERDFDECVKENGCGKNRA